MPPTWRRTTSFTGIQRVIREIGQRVLDNPGPATVAGSMVRLDGTVLRHARGFAAGILGLPGYGLPDLPVLTIARGRYAGADGQLRHHWPDRSWPKLRRLAPPGRARRSGHLRHAAAAASTVVSAAGASLAATMALRETQAIADGALCISRAVAGEVMAWLDATARDGAPVRKRPLDVGWFHLGSDFDATVAGPGGRRRGRRGRMAALAARPTLLMVGTVEPRKGHEQSLDAFEQLWMGGEGGRGWSSSVSRAGRPIEYSNGCANMPKPGRRLHWLRHPADEHLAKLYQGSSGPADGIRGRGF